MPCRQRGQYAYPDRDITRHAFPKSLAGNIPGIPRRVTRTCSGTFSVFNPEINRKIIPESFRVFRRVFPPGFNRGFRRRYTDVFFPAASDSKTPTGPDGNFPAAPRFTAVEHNGDKKGGRQIVIRLFNRDVSSLISDSFSCPVYILDSQRGIDFNTLTLAFSCKNYHGVVGEVAAVLIQHFTYISHRNGLVNRMLYPAGNGIFN